jgi:hypothetical protein
VQDDDSNPDCSSVEYIPQQAIWVQPRETDTGISWMDPRKIEELLRSTQKSKILQFIDQAGRQLACFDHPNPQVHIVLGLYHVAYRTEERTRYSMEEFSRQGALTSIWSTYRPLMVSRCPFDLTAQYAGYLEDDERTIPKALDSSHMGSMMSNVSRQMGEDEWEEWLS